MGGNKKTKKRGNAAKQASISRQGGQQPSQVTVADLLSQPNASNLEFQKKGSVLGLK